MLASWATQAWKSVTETHTYNPVEVPRRLKPLSLKSSTQDGPSILGSLHLLRTLCYENPVKRPWVGSQTLIVIVIIIVLVIVIVRITVVMVLITIVIVVMTIVMVIIIVVIIIVIVIKPYSSLKSTVVRPSAR